MVTVFMRPTSAPRVFDSAFDSSHRAVTGVQVLQVDLVLPVGGADWACASGRKMLVSAHIVRDGSRAKVDVLACAAPQI